MKRNLFLFFPPIHSADLLWDSTSWKDWMTAYCVSFLFVFLLESTSMTNSAQCRDMKSPLACYFSVRPPEGGVENPRVGTGPAWKKTGSRWLVCWSDAAAKIISIRRNTLVPGLFLIPQMLQTLWSTPWHPHWVNTGKRWIMSRGHGKREKKQGTN